VSAPVQVIAWRPVSEMTYNVSSRQVKQKPDLDVA